MGNAPKDLRIIETKALLEKRPPKAKPQKSRPNKIPTHPIRRKKPGKDVEKEKKREDPSSKYIPKKKNLLRSLRFRSLNPPEIIPAKGIAVRPDREKIPVEKLTLPPASLDG